MIVKAKVPVYAVEIIREDGRHYLTDTNSRILKSHLREEMQALEDNRRREATKFDYQILPGNVVLLGVIEMELELPEGALKLI